MRGCGAGGGGQGARCERCAGVERPAPLLIGAQQVKGAGELGMQAARQWDQAIDSHVYQSAEMRADDVRDLPGVLPRQSLLGPQRRVVDGDHCCLRLARPQLQHLADERSHLLLLGRRQISQGGVA